MAEDLILIISIVAALAIGLGGGLLFSSVFGGATKRAKALENEVDNLRKEKEQYRKQVSEHFQKTAHLFQDMTEQYKVLYTHLADGAETLCSENAAPPALDLPENPRLAEKTEDITEAEVKESQPTTEQPSATSTEDADATPTEDEIRRASEATVDPQDEDNILGDTPNIPDIPDEVDPGKSKIH